MKVIIGIVSEGENCEFNSTLEALNAQTCPKCELVSLENEIDYPSEAATFPSSKIRPRTIHGRGVPALFNRLVAECAANVYVLLQSGAIVGPGWLERLISALTMDRRNGLAGPSTNRSWNVQAMFPTGIGTPQSVASVAQQAAEGFNNEVRTLEPLYSLADFCYAVRREVIEDIGPADEGYGLGPCWEMDYNIRAARAGWRGVWVCSAYVWRPPMSAQRQRDEARFFQSSKQRYQDKFCGARLRGEKHDYRSHCRGDACPNFAPIQFMERWRLSSQNSALRHIESELPAVSNSPHAERVCLRDSPPVTCIMPTFNRRPFIAGTIANFLQQDYPNLELLIVDDGTDSISDLVPSNPRIRYIPLREKKILGDKRNFACAQARGDFIVHWDDDDWYPTDRVSRQICRLLQENADICGTSQLYYYDQAAHRAWLYRYSGGSRGWVAGNTLAYRRTFWQRRPFPSLQIGEDTRFVWSDARSRICDLKDPSLCVARVHSANTSRKSISGHCWLPKDVSEIKQLLGPKNQFFVGDGKVYASSACSGSVMPLVSCIMPTANRRNFVRLALRCFQEQDYPAKELIIVDDAQDNLSALLDGLPDVRYIPLSSRTTIGAKRNLACQAARGSFIAHWDDDDWYGPTRLSHQLAPLLRGEADITGIESRFVLDLQSGDFWTLSPALHRRMFVNDVHGGTLVFRKSIFTDGVRYPEVDLAEDAAFLRAAGQKRARLARLLNPDLFVYVRHGRNAWKFVSGRFLDSSGWQRIEGPTAFLPNLPRYQAAQCT